MPVMVLDRELANDICEGRGFVASLERRREEVWDGVTYIMPEADVEHDNIAGFFYRTFWAAFGGVEGVRIQFRANLSDRIHGWRSNYRVPDSMVFLEGNTSRSCGTHYVGGPSIALEVTSPDDYSREKLDFYAAISTQEVIILDRDPWQMELYQLIRGKMKSIGKIKAGDGEKLNSSLAPLSYQLEPGDPRPQIKIVHTQTGQEWVG